MIPFARRSMMTVVAWVIGVAAVGGSAALAATDWNFGPKPGIAILVHEIGTRKPIPRNHCWILEGNTVVREIKNAPGSGKPVYVPLKAGKQYTLKIIAPGYRDVKGKPIKLSKGKIDYEGAMMRQ